MAGYITNRVGIPVSRDPRKIKRDRVKPWIPSVCGSGFHYPFGLFQTTNSGHPKVYRGRLGSILPMHGANEKTGNGLEMKIKKALGLK